jgi:hypothetical protein
MNLGRGIKLFEPPLIFAFKRASEVLRRDSSRQLHALRASRFRIGQRWNQRHGLVLEVVVEQVEAAPVSQACTDTGSPGVCHISHCQGSQQQTVGNTTMVYEAANLQISSREVGAMKVRTSVVILALLFALSAAAQNKVNGTQHCPKPRALATAEAGDEAGHTMTLEKTTCTWVAPFEMVGEKSKEGTFVAFSEQSSAYAATNGTYVGTMDSGDKFYVRFRWTTLKDRDSANVKGDWTFTGGTGKLKGITGKGTYTATENEKGGELNMEGEYSVPKTDNATK